MARTRKVEFKFDERSLESIEKMERQGRVLGGEVLKCFSTQPPVVRMSMEEVYEEIGFCRVPKCPKCGADMDWYDGGEDANYEADLLSCVSCGHVCAN